MHHRTSRAIVAVSLALAVTAITAAPSLARAMSMAAARNAISNHAYVLTIQTSADHFRVTGCFRRSSTRVNCHVTIYAIPTNSALVDCSFYSMRLDKGNSRRIHLGDTKPNCRIA